MVFSVLIANYNNSRFLEVAIQSVMDQSYSAWEIIVVDDASTDGFEKVIINYRAEKRIKIFRNHKNKGCGYTKRRCASLATGSIMGFLDPDDALHPDALLLMTQAHQANPQHSIVHSTHYICDAELHVKKIASYPRMLPANTPYLLLGDGSVHAFVSFKKIFYMMTNGISPRNKKAVDQDLVYKLEEKGEILFINRPLYFYRIHKGSISNEGQERAAMMIHYGIAMRACQRRLRAIKNEQASGELKSAYKTRYYKLMILLSVRQQKWLQVIWGLAAFSVVGGRRNISMYLSKLPREGISLIRKSFYEDYKIEA